MDLNSLFNFICGINKSTTFLHRWLPIIYAFILLFFIVLGITGIIAFSMGKRFKNAARDIYGLVHLMTTFISMLIIFHLTYCSLVIPSNSINVGITNDEPLIRKRKDVLRAEDSATAIDENTQEKPPPAYDKVQFGGLKIKDNLNKLITKVIESANNLIENNTVPFILVQVLCTCIIVILTTVTSAIFSGISKAGYEMHCRESNQVFTIPWWANLVDIFMYLLLIISSVFLVLYFILKMFKDGFTTLNAGFGLKPCEDNKKSLSIQELILSMGNKIDNPDIQQAVMETSAVINEWPRMKALFVISLSYYISQLFLRMIEDIISNNIVLLTRWQKRETECSDEPNKESKTNMERGFTLFCNILILIVTIIVTIIVLIVNFWFFPMIRQAINLVYDKYTPIAATINVPITTKSVQDTLREVTDGQVKIEPFVKELETELDAATGPNGDIDISKLLAGPPENDMHHGVHITKRAKTTTNKPIANNIPNEIEEEIERERERERERARRDVVSNKNNSNPTSNPTPNPTPDPAPPLPPPPEPVPTPVPEPPPPTK